MGPIKSLHSFCLELKVINKVIGHCSGNQAKRKCEQDCKEVINPDKEIVYFMDSIRRRLIGDEWRIVVDNGIKIFNAQVNRQGRKTIIWKNMADIPQQPSDKKCGYFVMRFMKEIIEDEGLAFVNKWERRQDNTYTQEDIDEVRAEWANFVGQFM